MEVPSYGPKCPNHGCPLEGYGFPMPKKGVGTCQVSGVPFSFVLETEDNIQKETVDKFGNKTKVGKWKVEGKD